MIETAYGFAGGIKQHESSFPSHVTKIYLCRFLGEVSCLQGIESYRLD